MSEIITTYCRRCGKEQPHEIYISTGGYLHSLCTECGKDVGASERIDELAGSMFRECGSEGASRYHIKYISTGGYIHWFCCTCGKDIGSSERVKGGGCFITTATCEVYGLDENCEILEKLRRFRDTFMMQTNERKEIIKMYYKNAPRIVENINIRHDKDEVYGKIMDTYILPTFQAIKDINELKAFEIAKEALIFSLSLLEKD